MLMSIFCAVLVFKLKAKVSELMSYCVTYLVLALTALCLLNFREKY